MYHVSALKFGTLRNSFGRTLGYNEVNRTYKTYDGMIAGCAHMANCGMRQIMVYGPDDEIHSFDVAAYVANRELRLIELREVTPQ